MGGGDSKLMNGGREGSGGQKTVKLILRHQLFKTFNITLRPKGIN